MKNWYGFSEGRADGNRDMKEDLGGKGANLAEMCNLGLPVPPGFTLPTAVCKDYYDAGGKLSAAVIEAIDAGIGYAEKALDGRRFGDPERPLLFSVRSGARASMPGMMDTVLNIGLNEKTLAALARASDSRRFALDSYRRLIQMYGDVVRDIDRKALDEPLERIKKDRNIEFDYQLGADDLDKIVKELLGIYQDKLGEPFPEDPREQLRQAVAAVFRSWGNKRAQSYRALHGIPEAWGTAVNVQAMVFGNFGDSSGTGVAFTRNPSTGLKEVMGEWLPNAQGEDVVAGIRTPGPLHKKDGGDGVPSLEATMPKAYTQVCGVMDKLEKHYTDMQDVEFTVQEDRLYMLQTRAGKRTAAAALRIAMEMEREGLIDKRTALFRVTPEQIEQLMHPQIDPEADKDLLASGLPASPGSGSGVIVLEPDEAAKRAAKGESVVLVRKETSPEDIEGMHAAKAILTATGGMTSHAAVVARGMGRPCIAGCNALSIDAKNGSIAFRKGAKSVTLRVGEAITLDGSCGEVYRGEVPTVQADLSGGFGAFLSWADEVRRLKVRANADTPNDAAKAVELGAEGIGLTRTEHMFFGPERILAVREMILADDLEARKKALAKLEPMQRQDFVGIFKAMAGKPVTIRLLDPPLHEFLPHGDETAQVAQSLGVSVEALQEAVKRLSEFNPMLGHRGCRLGLTYPEVYEMQARAIIEAACDVAAEKIEVLPEIMIPLVMEPKELERLRERVQAIATKVLEARGQKLDYLIGTMIELPRAALLADRVADHADFFSFGTNDLTQTTLGLSRDDSGRFLPEYVESGLFAEDPFASLDRDGVGELVKMACERGRKTKSDLKLGICGEHGGDPASVHFFDEIGLEYVSCSPFRVPVARLAAAQATLKKK